MPGYAMSKNDLMGRLSRIEGQVRGVRQMVSDDRYCIDVLTQITAITRALDAVAVGLLDEHLRHCVVDAVGASGDEGTRLLDEASAAVARLVRS